jgi:hypothetical protein
VQEPIKNHFPIFGFFVSFPCIYRYCVSNAKAEIITETITETLSATDPDDQVA